MKCSAIYGGRDLAFKPHNPYVVVHFGKSTSRQLLYLVALCFYRNALNQQHWQFSEAGLDTMMFLRNRKSIFLLPEVKN